MKGDATHAAMGPRPLHAATCLLLLAAVLAGRGYGGPARPPIEEKPDAKQAEGPDRAELARRQKRLADRYARLEQILLRLAELSAANQPRRAALLREAISQSKQRDLANQFDAVVRLLEEGRLALADKRQRQLDGELQQLLTLLLKQESAGRTESEKQKLRRYLKQLNRLIKQQRGVKGRTEGGEPERSVGRAQRQVREKTQELIDTLSRDAAQPSSQSDAANQDKAGGKGGETPKPPDRGAQRNPLRSPEPADKSKEPKQADGKDSQGGKAAPGKATDAPRQDGPSQDGKGKPQDGGPPPSAKDASAPDGQPEDGVEAASKRVQAARQRMQQAEEALEKAKRDRAIDRQQEAIDALAQAKAELERILRQLREEEIQQVLVRLEARFRKMLEEQRTINEGTGRLDQIPVDQRAHDDEIEAGRLGRREATLADAANQAVMLLREEGTSVAFPEAVEQMRDEMQQVADRLVRVQVGVVTQEKEAEIVRALEEAIAALRKALRDQEQRKNSGAPPGSGSDADPRLIDALAELRMIRTLQMRVNRRTQRYEKLLADGTATRDDCVEALRRLAEHQQRIRQATDDLHWGKGR